MTNNLCRIYVVRHGESEANIRKEFGLSPESRLTRSGEEQVKLLSERLKPVPINTIFTSDLTRAKQTAEIIAKERNLAVLTKKALHERSYGKLNGKTEEEIRIELTGVYQEYLAMSDRDKYFYKLVHDMETVDEALSRFL